MPGDSTYKTLLKTGYFPVCLEGTAFRDGYENYEICSIPFKFLFDKYKSHLSRYSNVPLNLIQDLMTKLATPLFGEYVETTDNQDFLRISSAFTEYLFGNEELFLSYEDFNALLDSVKVDTQQEELLKAVKLDFVFPEGKSLQMGYKGSRDEQDRWHFIHIDTGLEFIRPDGKEAFIRVTGDGLRNGSNRWSEGFRLCYKMLIDQENIDLLSHLCTKRMKVHFMDNSERGIKELSKSLHNGLPFFHDKEDNYFVMSTTELQTSDDYLTYQEAICTMGDRKLAELGIISNMNPKKERLTTGENYKDIVTIANRQRLVLNQLKLLGMETQKRGGFELQFAINGMPESDAMEEDGEDVEREEESESSPAGD